MKINEDEPDENKQRLPIQSLLQQGSQLTSITCVFTGLEEKEQGFRYVLIGDCWHEEDVGGLSRNKASCAVVSGAHWICWMVLSWKAEQKLGKLPVINLIFAYSCIVEQNNTCLMR